MFLLLGKFEYLHSAQVFHLSGLAFRGKRRCFGFLVCFLLHMNVSNDLHPNVTRTEEELLCLHVVIRL